MAQMMLRVVCPNGDERTVSVVDATTVREILQQCHEEDVQDRQANLLRGETLLEPDMTVCEVGLEDGEEISILWSDHWKSGQMRVLISLFICGSHPKQHTLIVMRFTAANFWSKS